MRRKWNKIGQMIKGLVSSVRKVKRSYGLGGMLGAVVIMGLCFVFLWSFFSSSSVASRRRSFDDIDIPSLTVSPFSLATPTTSKEHPQSDNPIPLDQSQQLTRPPEEGAASTHIQEKTAQPNTDGSTHTEESNEQPDKGSDQTDETDEQPDGDGYNQTDETIAPPETDGSAQTEETIAPPDTDESSHVEETSARPTLADNHALFDPNATYTWRLCNTRSKHNYLPCIDIETATPYRHSERSCPKPIPTCLVPLPRDGYAQPIPWPQSATKIVYKNIAHPKLAFFVKKSIWISHSDGHLLFNRSQSNARIQNYMDLIEEMAPDIDWGKNVRVVLNLGCLDSSFESYLLEKDVLTLSLGSKYDLVDLAQVALERGFPAFVTPFKGRRLPFPSDVFDAIHCGLGCTISWHSNPKLLIEVNRILRRGGYFILSTKQDSIEDAQALTALTASLCWNILGHRTDDENEMNVRVYHKPETNDNYALRRKKNPPMCPENENPDESWYYPLKNCLHSIASSLEQHGSEWPEEWPKRLEAYPDWISDKEKVASDTNMWKAIFQKSYLNGIGIDWTTIRNVLDMKANHGGFAAALIPQKIWVMNVIPVHSPITLPLIFDRGLIGVYHDWCEPFGTYPRSYDLLHADHLFSRLRNRCKEPVTVVVEMDRILRPGGWAIVRDRVQILAPLERIFRSLHWEIRMAYNQDAEGILCVQKTSWRPN